MFHWEIKELYKLYLYVGLLFVFIWNLPNSIWTVDYAKWVVIVGTLGIWRYSWWCIHFIRSIIYKQYTFKRYRAEASRLLEAHWRPKKVFFLLTVYNEESVILERTLRSILREAKLLAVPCELFVGTVDEEIEARLFRCWNWCHPGTELKLHVIRQRIPGKRDAMGAVLRAMSRQGVGGDDPVVFMDGDAVLTRGSVLKCLPFFELHPKMHALTTYECALVRGPGWFQDWFALRFAQRNMMMQSHALSKKVLTLTGRMSIFRGHIVMQESFISLIENDYLSHWLWGNFKFLSGDDKSTWYALLKMKAEMLYIPDAIVYTIDEMSTDGLTRLKDNMLRWGGNILRNGWRAILLGPQKVGFFIWWCLIDQRIVIFTMMIAPSLSLMGGFLVKKPFLSIYIVWIFFSRLCLSIAYFYHEKRMNMRFPFLLYYNQFLTSAVKIYLVFRLPQQRWANRGDQEYIVPGSRRVLFFKRAMASYMTFFLVMAVTYFALVYAELLPTLVGSDINAFIF
jgi:glycosyltransferase Alg8